MCARTRCDCCQDRQPLPGWRTTESTCRQWLAGTMVMLAATTPGSPCVGVERGGGPRPFAQCRLAYPGKVSHLGPPKDQHALILSTNSDRQHSLGRLYFFGKNRKKCTSWVGKDPLTARQTRVSNKYARTFKCAGRPGRSPCRHLTPQPGSQPHASKHGCSRPRAPRLPCGAGVRPPPHAWRASKPRRKTEEGPPHALGLWGRAGGSPEGLAVGQGRGLRESKGCSPQRASPAQSRGLTMCGGWTLPTEGSDVIFPAEGWVLMGGPRLELS